MNRSFRLRIGFASLAVFFCALVSIIAWKTTSAIAADTSAVSQKVTVSEINYKNSSITIKANSGDTKIFFSDAKGKTWEAVPGTLASDKTITMDISWIPVSSNYTIKFKGDQSQTVNTVVIPKQLTTFKAKYNRVKQEVTYSNRGERTVQWRKKDSYIWNDVSSSFALDLEKLSAQGTTVYLRLAPVNGEITGGTFNAGQRPSKEVALSIPKKADAPTITIDGSKFLIPVKKNYSYCVVTKDNEGKETWIPVSTGSDLMLADIAPSTLYAKDATQSEVTLKFRVNATSSTSASRITTITVPVQEAPPSIKDCGINLEYTSSSSFDLSVKAASATQPFEYTIVNPDDTFDYQQLTWTSITSSAKISITDTKAKEGSHIYIRKKSLAATEKVKFALASKECEVTGSAGIKYPAPASAQALKTLITTAGVVNEDETSSHMEFTIYSPTKTTVSSIKLRDSYGDTKGTLTSLKSTVTRNTSNKAGIADAYIITTKITSTASIDSITEEALYGTIVLANGDEVESTKTSGIVIYIYPKTVINNKSDKTYTNSFDRILSSNDTKNDETSFKFNLDFGKMYKYDENEIDKHLNQKVEINKMTYNGHTLEPKDYCVTYDDSQENDEHVKIRKAIITVHVDKFEKSSDIKKRNSAEPLVIYLSNGEVLDKLVTIKLIETATIEEAPVAYSITEGSLDVTKTETVTNSDNTTSSVTKEVVTFSLKLNIFDPTYDVGISDVTWGGVSIMKSAEISGGVATIKLSNPKINKLTTEVDKVIKPSRTENIVITLSNGYVINKGCKLTIIKKSDGGAKDEK